MPVLPLVASTITLPGWSVPDRSAASTIASAALSFTLPLGFLASSFAKTREPDDGAIRARSTIGVPPTKPRTPAVMISNLSHARGSVQFRRQRARGGICRAFSPHGAARRLDATLLEGRLALSPR